MPRSIRTPNPNLYTSPNPIPNLNPTSLASVPVLTRFSTTSVGVPSSMALASYPVSNLVAVKPNVIATNGNGGTLTPELHVNTLLGAQTWYNAGFTGTNARVANIEIGHPWLGHETLNWMLPGNLFNGIGTTTPSYDSHATSVSHSMVGRGAGNLQRGIAYGVLPANFWGGHIDSGQYEPYYNAMITGINGNPANLVDVTNSSWGYVAVSTTGFELGSTGKYHDALIYRANTVGAARHGVTSVFSAGNEGDEAPFVNSIGAPVNSFNNFVVGALGGVYGATDVAPTYTFPSVFSSRGLSDAFIPTTVFGAPGTTIPAVRARVDISAPGEHLRLARSTSNATDYAETQGTSFSSPIVAGGIALLSDYARTTFTNPTDVANAIDTRVIKAVLMNSAYKTGAWNNAQTLNSGVMRTTQALDGITGAGRMDLDQAYRQYVAAAGATQLLAASASNTGLNNTGWARGDINRPVAANTVNHDFYLANPVSRYSELNATLSWLINRGFSNITFGNVEEVGFHNLNLEIWRYDNSTNTPIAKVAESNALYIANQHLSILAPEDGHYMIRVLRPGGAAGQLWSFAGDTTNDVYGLAWMTRNNAIVTSAQTNFVPNTTTAGYQPSVLVAPTTGDTGSLTYNGGASYSIPNTLYIGGNDRATGGSASLTITGTNTTLTVGNRVRVFPGSGITLSSGSFLQTGEVDLPTGSTLTLPGTGTYNLRAWQIRSGINLIAAASQNLRLGDVLSGFNNAAQSFLTPTANISVGGTGTVRLTGWLDLNSQTVTKTGTGTFIIDAAAYPVATATGLLRIQQGTVTLTNTSALPKGANVTVESGTTFNIHNTSNSTLPLGTLTINGGTVSPNSNSTGGYFMKNLVFTGGTFNITGATAAFEIDLTGSGASVTTNAAATTATITGANTSSLRNNTTAALPITVAAGTPANGIDFDVAAIITNNTGTSPAVTKLGPGTMRISNPANTGNFTVTAGRLRYDSVGALGSGTVSLNGGTLAYAGPTATEPKAIGVSANSSLNVSTAGTALTTTGVIAFGGNTLTKTGPGTLIMTGTNTGTTSAVLAVNEGTLRTTTAASVPTGSLIRVSSPGSFDLQTTIDANITVNSGVLLGTGGQSATRTLTINGGTFDPGLARGAVSTFTPANVVANSTGRYAWDVSATTGTAGTNWDIVTASGALTGNATNASPFIVDIYAAPTVTGFNNSVSTSWIIASFTNGISLPTSSFSANPIGWTGVNSFGSGAFTVAVVGNDLMVTFTPVPEPALLLGMAAFGLCLVRRIRNRRETVMVDLKTELNRA
ncbi:MAG: S8 family serine peptidase [Fimbriiglobus sp.]